MAHLDVYGRRDGKNKQVVGQVTVDDELLPKLSAFHWTSHPEGYAHRWIPETKASQYLHYFVWEHHNGVDSVPDDKYLDHLNQDKRDNRIENLVIVDGRVKQANAPKFSNNTTGYKDVGARPNGRFEAAVSGNNKQRYIGYYATLEEAAHAVNIAYEILHPEVPTPNVLPQDALTDDQMNAVEDNVRRLLRPDRKPNEP